ncbi:MAG: hypothetical protein H6Q90_3770 [Deltaproteobacteria bacterium]|nr:hypothetical protein [Deltaproteobacteria bacterium]
MNIRLLGLMGSFGTLIACGDGGGDNPTPPDAPVIDHGFNKPTKSLKANMETAPKVWAEIGPADLTCLNTATADVATTVEVTASTTVHDFQTTSPVPGAMVVAFPGSMISAPFGAAVVADGTSKVSITIPVGTKRFGYKITDPSSMDTLLLNQTVMPDVALQDVDVLKPVSKTTAQTLPALLGVSRTAGTGVLAGAMRDCQNREISNAIATVSSTSAAVTPLEGADSYYFAPAVGLPVRHTQKSASSEDGLFLVLELPATASAFVQVWGYRDDAALAADNLELIAELATPVIGDTVITGSYEPLRTGQ